MHQVCLSINLAYCAANSKSQCGETSCHSYSSFCDFIIKAAHVAYLSGPLRNGEVRSEAPCVGMIITLYCTGSRLRSVVVIPRVVIIAVD